MELDRAEAAFWSTWIRNRNVDAVSAQDGAVSVAGGYALCLAGTTLEHAVGAGSTRPLRADDLAVLRDFYGRRGLPPRAELHEAVWQRDGALLRDAGYAEEAPPLAILTAATAAEAPRDAAVTVRQTTDRQAWIDLVVRSWASEPPPADGGRVLRAIHATAASAHGLFIAAIGGTDVGAGAATLMREYVLLSAGSVLPEARRKGAHRALVAARLAFGHQRGAAVAATKVTPESGAEQSAAQAGFARSHLRRRLSVA